MIRKLEDLYYYSSIIVLTLLLLSYFFTSGKTAGHQDPYGIPSVTPSELVETEEGTRCYSFPGNLFHLKNETLVFQTSHQLVEVYADGGLVYSVEAENTRFGNTTGTRWNFVDIPAGAEEVQVRLTNIYPSSPHSNTSFYYGNGGDIYRGLLRNSFLPMLLSLLHIVIGVCMVIFWLLINNKAPINRALVFLGMLALCIGLWWFLESDMSMLLLKNRVSASYSSFVLLMFLLMPFASFIRELLETNDTKGWYIIFVYSVANLVVTLILQTLQIADLQQTLITTYIGFGLLLVYTVYSVIRAIHIHGLTKLLLLNTACLVLLSFSLIFDLANQYIHWTLAGQLGKLGFTLYTIITGIATSSSALKQMEEGKKAVYYKELVNTDILTGLNNRNAYITDIHSGGFGSDSAVVLFDLNELKHANDVLGHAMGDKYLKDSAKLISAVFGDRGKCYRIGGDEFCAILRDTGEAEVRERISLLKQKQEEYNRASQKLSMKIACGYAMYEPERDHNLETTRSRADQEMYLDKAVMKRPAGLPAEP